MVYYLRVACSYALLVNYVYDDYEKDFVKAVTDSRENIFKEEVKMLSNLQFI
jgi:hypothetical protein